MSDQTITVAAIQMEPHSGDNDRNIAHSLALVTEACDHYAST